MAQDKAQDKGQEKRQDKGDPEAKPEVKFITIAVPRDLANRLRVVAAHRETTMQDMLELLLRGPLDRAYRKCVDSANQELGESGA